MIFTTSELAFVDENSMDGIKTRAFQIEDTLTRNAENADNIKSCIMQHYGVPGEKYIQHLVEKGQSIIEADYEKYKDILISQCKKIEEKWLADNSDKMSELEYKHYEQSKRLTERILSKLAIVVQATAYAKELFDFKVEIADVVKYALNLANAIESTQTPEEQLLNVVYEDVLKNTRKYRMTQHFIQKVFGRRTAEDMNTDIFCFGCVGLIRLCSSNKYYEICIAKNYFEQMMKNNGITDFRKRLKSLRETGILVAEKDRLVSREKIIDMLDSKVYVLRYFFEEKFESVQDKLIETYLKEIEEIELSKRKAVDIIEDDDEPAIDID